MVYIFSMRLLEKLRNLFYSNPLYVAEIRNKLTLLPVSALRLAAR